MAEMAEKTINPPTCPETECSGCFYENEMRTAQNALKCANEEIEDLKEKLADTRYELDALKRSLCEARHERQLLVNEAAALKKMYEAARGGALKRSDLPRAYVDFIARLRRTMDTAPGMQAVAEEA